MTSQEATEQPEGPATGEGAGDPNAAVEGPSLPGDAETEPHAVKGPALPGDAPVPPPETHSGRAPLSEPPEALTVDSPGEHKSGALPEHGLEPGAEPELEPPAAPASDPTTRPAVEPPAAPPPFEATVASPSVFERPAAAPRDDPLFVS